MNAGPWTLFRKDLKGLQGANGSAESVTLDGQIVLAAGSS
jgi:hypothetical protein